MMYRAKWCEKNRSRRNSYASNVWKKELIVLKRMTPSKSLNGANGRAKGFEKSYRSNHIEPNVRHNRCKHYTNCPSYWTCNLAINRWIHLAEWWTKEWINAVEQSQIKRIVHFQYLCIRAPNTIPSIQHHIEFVLFKVGEIIYTLIRKSYSKMHDCSRSDQSDCNMKWTHFFPSRFELKRCSLYSIWS